jgi:regulator of replication initiation timing
LVCFVELQGIMMAGEPVSVDLEEILAENKALKVENRDLLREIELLEQALSEPKQRRRKRGDDE